MEGVTSSCEAVAMDSEDPLFIMYTSGTTGDPTGIIHTQAGYLLYAAMTHKVSIQKLYYVYDIYLYISIRTQYPYLTTLTNI